MSEIMDRLSEGRSETKLLLLEHKLRGRSSDLALRASELDVREANLSEMEHTRATEVEFSSQSYAAFFNTKLEKDKSILTISVAGIGFLLTAVGLATKLALWEYILFSIPACCYLFCIYQAINIFDGNGELIIAMMTEDPTVDEKNKKLDKMDKIVRNVFIAGIVLSLILWLKIVYTKNVGENKLSENKIDIKQVELKMNDSFAGASMIKKSFGGAGSMKPVQTPQPVAQNRQPVKSNSGSKGS